MPQKQGAVKQQGQCERAVVAQNRGSVVLFWVPTLKESVPPRALFSLEKAYEPDGASLGSMWHVDFKK